ncbi:MAG: adenylyltransferase/cytidyltransferase family protein, partial [Tumebacillaceae bacterium]
MEIIRIHDLPDGHVCKPSVMAVGNFDGIHIGHQQLIGKAKEIAALSGLPASVLTFYPHPRQVLGKGSYANLLTPFDEKMRVLRELGVQIRSGEAGDLAQASVDVARLDPDAGAVGRQGLGVHGLRLELAVGP